MNEESTASEKRELRRVMRQQRLTHSATREAGEAQLQDRVLTLLRKEKCLGHDVKIAIYLATPGEVNLHPLVALLQEQGVEVLAPAYDDEARPFHMIAAGGSNVEEVVWKNLRLLTPRVYSGGSARAAVEIDAICVPGLAFDGYGNRLGQGGGWYDRVLADAQHALKIGIAFDWQIVDELPYEPHDVCMDYVVTDLRTLKTKY